MGDAPRRRIRLGVIALPLPAEGEIQTDLWRLSFAPFRVGFGHARRPLRDHSGRRYVRWLFGCAFPSVLRKLAGHRRFCLHFRPGDLTLARNAPGSHGGNSGAHGSDAPLRGATPRQETAGKPGHAGLPVRRDLHDLPLLHLRTGDLLDSDHSAIRTGRHEWTCARRQPDGHRRMGSPDISCGVMALRQKR